jgi:hypothetical protein
VKCQLVMMAAIAALLGSGCPSDDDDDDDAHQVDHDAGYVDPDEMVRCPDGIPEFFAGETSGSEATGENDQVMARVIAADHVPLKRFSNTWTVELTSPDGTPLEGVEIVEACAYMPVHRHGLPPRAVKALAEPGRFVLDRLNFTMRGPWEMQLAVNVDGEAEASGRATDCDPTASGSDYLAFQVCVMDE